MQDETLTVRIITDTECNNNNTIKVYRYFVAEF